MPPFAKLLDDPNARSGAEHRAAADVALRTETP